MTSYRGLISVGPEALNIVKGVKDPPVTISTLNLMHEGLSKEPEKQREQESLREIN